MDLPLVREVERRGGHRALRIYFLTDDDGARAAILEKLVQSGATYENADDKMYALDLEPGANLEGVLRFLDEEEAAGSLGWESGWS